MKMVMRKKILYMILFAYAVFAVAIRWMAGQGVEPTLFPLKLEIVYVVACVVCLAICGIRHGKARKDAGKSSVLGIFVWIGVVVLMAGYIYSRQFRMADEIQHLADCNSVKLQGVTIPDVAAMAGYYLEQLAGIPTEITIRFVMPALFFVLMGMVLYEAAAAMYVDDAKKSGIVFLLETVIFITCGKWIYSSGVVQYSILNAEQTACVFLPVLVFALLLNICCTNCGRITKKDCTELFLIVLLALLLNPRVLVLCLVSGLIGAGYMMVVRYSSRIGNSAFNFMVFYCLITILICINPWSGANFWSAFYAEDEIWMIWQMLPVVLAAAYCIVTIPHWIRNNKKLLAAGSAVCIGVLITGMLAEPRIETESRNADHGVWSDCEDIVSEIPLDDPMTKVLAPDEVMEYLRAGSMNVGLLYEPGLITSDHAENYYDTAVLAIHESMLEPKNKLGQIVQIVKGNQCSYLIIPLEADERWEMEQGGFSVIKENDKFVLYYCPVI